MARKGAEYSDEELAEMYRRYAELKGWSTKDVTVQDKVEGWRDSSIGPVGLAIDFHETGNDNAKHIGNDAEAKATKQEKGGGGCACIFLALVSTAFAVVALLV